MQQQGTRQYAIIRAPFPPRVPPPRTSGLFSVQGLRPVESIGTSKSSGLFRKLLNVSLETSTGGMTSALTRASSPRGTRKRPNLSKQTYAHFF